MSHSADQDKQTHDYAKNNTPVDSLAHAFHAYLDNVLLARSQNTADTYKHAIALFGQVLAIRHIDPDKTPAAALPEDAVAWFAAHLKNYAAATELLYLQAAKGFYEFLAAEGLAEPNLPRVRLLIRQRARRPGVRLPQFPREDIEKVLAYARELSSSPAEDPAEQLRNLRDRAFLITLADTGLRVHEACRLRRGDLDWNEARAVIIGKGDKQAVVRFSSRAIKALRDYLSARAALDGASGRPLPSLPLFARHDKGAGKKVRGITTTTGRAIVHQRVKECLGAEATGSITPHSFRHYFVTTVLRASGNLKLAQELARHQSISVTQRYAHLADDELDKGYHEAFEDHP
jgi:integrase/recombinase XerC